MLSDRPPAWLSKNGKAAAFVSYCYALDGCLLERLTEESQGPDSPFQVIASSADVADGPGRWAPLSKVIQEADIVVVVLGTLVNALGSIGAEVDMARQSGKPIVAVYEHLEDVGLADSISDRAIFWTWEALRDTVLALQW
jgi:hypothetical protein